MLSFACSRRTGGPSGGPHSLRPVSGPTPTCRPVGRRIPHNHSHCAENVKQQMLCKEDKPQVPLESDSVSSTMPSATMNKIKTRSGPPGNLQVFPGDGSAHLPGRRLGPRCSAGVRGTASVSGAREAFAGVFLRTSCKFLISFFFSALILFSTVVEYLCKN